jgi:hypothetical protein
VQTNRTVTIPEARAQVTVTLLGHPLIDMPVHVFSAAGAYLGLNAATAGNGQAGFRLPAGDYNFRADYLGSQYFSGNTTLIADQLNPITVSTGGGNFTLTVQEAAGVPMAGITCHLFSASGTYLGHQRATSDQGEASFELADGSYKVRVDHLGYQFWTPVFAIPATATLSFDIPHEDTVQRDHNGNILPGENIKVKRGRPCFRVLHMKGFPAINESCPAKPASMHPVPCTMSLAEASSAARFFGAIPTATI